MNNTLCARGEEVALFPFDDRSVPLTYGLSLGLVQGKKEGVVLEAGEKGKPDGLRVHYYGTVVRIREEFRMWYLAEDEANDGIQRMCYAVSEDGIHWERPELGLVEFGGNKRNNLVQLLEPKNCVLAAPIIYDPGDPVPARRFKMAFESDKYGLRFGVAFSEDGLRWKESPCNPMNKHMLEMSGLVKFNGCYYVNGQGGGPRLGPARQMVTYISYDFEHWAEATALSFRREGGVIGAPYGGHAGEQIHLGASVWNRGNVILGVYGMWHGHESDDRRLVTMDLGLVVSNDAIHFREPIADFRLIPCREERDAAGPLPGGQVQFLSMQPALSQGQGFENVGDKTLYWYDVWAWGNVRLASWPRDRFGYYEVHRETREALIGVHGPRESWGEEPHFISCPIDVGGAGWRVFVNADGLSAGNYLKVEICDEQFRGLPGYSGDDCVAVTEGGFRQPVVWRGRDVLEKFGHPIRVRVNWGGARAEDVRVYAVYVSPP